jgi:hypothetical protein
MSELDDLLSKLQKMVNEKKGSNFDETDYAKLMQTPLFNIAFDHVMKGSNILINESKTETEMVSRSTLYIAALLSAIGLLLGGRETLEAVQKRGMTVHTNMTLDLAVEYIMAVAFKCLSVSLSAEPVDK